MREEVLARICEDVGHIYQDSCERSVEEVLASEKFIRVARIIKEEEPALLEGEIFTLILQIYSDVIRKQ